MKEITTITIEKKTKDRLAGFGKTGETFDTVLNKVLDELVELRTKGGLEEKDG